MRRPLTFALILILSGPILLSEADAQAPSGDEQAAGILSADQLTELQKKAAAGDSAAAFNLGHAYETGKGVHQNFERAAYWYRNAADWGNAAAQDSLGLLYWLGDGVDQDRKEAVKWYHKAAREGDANAMFNLGVAYYNGGGENIDDTRSYAWFLLASEAGSTAGRDAAGRSQSEHGQKATCDAQLSVAEMYEKGVDLPHNLNLAENWYRRAGKDHDCKEAKVRLASLFLNSGNYTGALEWCKAAANENLSGGAFCLGHLYQKGLGVNQDLKGAFQWYKKAANGGNTAAMVALGQMYKSGEATKIDRTEALFWLLRAAENGNPEALTEARKIRSSMTEKEWKAAQRELARNFNLKAIESLLQENSAKASK